MAQILIIDDDPQVRSLFRKMLEHDKHTVTEAENGKQGLRLYSEGSFDLVVTDLVMPEKEGLEVIMELQKGNPAVKIIAISGGGRTFKPEVFLLAAEGLGAIRTFTKPVERKALLDAVRELTS